MLGRRSIATNEGYVTGEIFVDEHTGHALVILSDAKSTLLADFKTYCTYVGALASRQVKRLHSDSESVFKTSKEFRTHCVDRGIQQTFSPPNRQELNGIAERTTRKISEMAVAMHDGSVKRAPTVLGPCAAVRNVRVCPRVCPAFRRQDSA